MQVILTFTFIFFLTCWIQKKNYLSRNFCFLNGSCGGWKRGNMDLVFKHLDRSWCSKNWSILLYVEELFPECKHRNCVRHIYANFSNKFKGKELKKALCNVAKATREGQFNMGIDYLKQLNPKANEWLSKQRPRNWCKPFFKFMSCVCVLMICFIFTCFVLKYRQNLTSSFSHLIVGIRLISWQIALLNASMER